MCFKKALVILALAACLTACGKSPALENNDIIVSEGFFLPCTNGSYLVIIDKQEPIAMSPDSGDNSIYDDLSAGDHIMVTHGMILETYPGQTTVYSIEKLSDGNLSDIPADTLANLEELGWIAATDSQENTQGYAD